jgi:hypothetical protein
MVEHECSAHKAIGADPNSAGPRRCSGARFRTCPNPVRGGNRDFGAWTDTNVLWLAPLADAGYFVIASKPWPSLEPQGR